jgi:hypothetical protein
MIFLSMINLNTSLNQHSLSWSLSFTCMLGFCFELYGVVFVRDYVTCIIMILGTLWKLFLFLVHSVKLSSQEFRHLQNQLFLAQAARELRYMCWLMIMVVGKHEPPGVPQESYCSELYGVGVCWSEISNKKGHDLENLNKGPWCQTHWTRPTKHLIWTTTSIVCTWTNP